MRPVWQELYDAGADVVLSAHEHNYERFAPQDPSGRFDRNRGIRQFVVGTGGSSHYAFGRILETSEARNAETFGVLVLTLHPASYDWVFVPVGSRLRGNDERSPFDRVRARNIAAHRPERGHSSHPEGDEDGARHDLSEHVWQHAEEPAQTSSFQAHHDGDDRAPGCCAGDAEAGGPCCATRDGPERVAPHAPALEAGGRQVLRPPARSHAAVPSREPTRPLRSLTRRLPWLNAG